MKSINKYGHIYNQTIVKINWLLSEEYQTYNQFLEDKNISSLPDGLYLYEGGWIDVIELRKLYDDWLKSRKKEIKNK